MNRRKSPIDDNWVEPHMCSVELRLEILGQLPFFSDLGLPEVQTINRSFVERGFAPHETIYFAGDPATRLYAVADGNVKLMHHTLKGHDVMLNILEPGEFFGSLASSGEETYAETAQAQTPVCTLSIGSQDFRKILRQHPPVSIKMMDIMGGRLRAAHEMMRQLSVYSTDQRIAFVLLKLGDKLGEQKDVGLLIQLPLSRGDLAQLSGTTTETASRVMSQFQKEGLIHTGRQWVAITNRAKLADLAEGM
jgi:CRP-like cAMP-binding protein